MRLPRFALMMVAYWVGMAGATVLLLRSLRERPEPSLAAERSEEPAAENTAPYDDARDPSEVNLQAASSPAATVTSEPAAVVTATSEPSPEPPVVVAEEPLAPGPPVRVEPRAPEPTVRLEPRVPERRVEPPALAALAPRSTETTARPREHVTPLLSTAKAPAEVPVAHVHEEPTQPEPPATSLPSCETAAASANQTVELGAAAAAPDLPREAFAAVLDNGAYLARCGLPPRTTLDICAAVEDGKVVGVSASSEPRNPALNACVRRAVAGLRFPKSPRLDVTRTRFDAAR
jgi:hypothetical protein